jgi:hypothetical protein
MLDAAIKTTVKQQHREKGLPGGADRPAQTDEPRRVAHEFEYPDQPEQDRVLRLKSDVQETRQCAE